MLTTTLIARLTKLYDNKYTYVTAVDNLRTKDKIEAVCRDHGSFITNVHDHLYNNSGCPMCGNESKRNVVDDFISRAAQVHGGKYVYSLVRCVDSLTPVSIICPTHGVFHQLPHIHLQSKIGCQQCRISARTTPKTAFIDRAREVHQGKYGYAAVVYVTCKHKVTVSCPFHGPFEQTPDNHLRGAGCPKCAGDTRRGKYVAGCTTAPNKPGILYVLEFSNDHERFIKVGITSRLKVSYQYGVKHHGYDIKPLYEFAMPIRLANEIEIQTLDALVQHKYVPAVKFGGYTECLDLPVEKVYDTIINLITTRE